MKPLTPLESSPALAAAIGVKALFLKREDLHPLGSHKGRSLPVMIERYRAAGDRRFALSSSGNAALAAALAVRGANAGQQAADPLSLDIFVGVHAAPHKLEKLRALADGHIRVLVKERPLQALAQAVGGGMRSLRQSTDDAALAGYGALADELAADPAMARGAAVFIGTSSGTTAQALAASFSGQSLPMQAHIVQVSSCHPMADAFESYDGPGERSIADAITDITALRKPALIPLIRKTGGSGWTVSDEAIRAAQEMAERHASLSLSPNGALPIAGAMRAASSGFGLPDAVVCIVGGE
ncbi:MAG: PLP-dependent lyase/thiolase [Patescibacteria group bacterium]|nr:PLP-dependent lyase/thiolase [Patescibacteria group bacterium]